MEPPESELQPVTSIAPVKHKKKTPKSPFEVLSMSVHDFLLRHPPSNDPSILLTTLPKRWSLYPPMILLPQSSFSSLEWKEYLTLLPDDYRNLFYSQITTTLKATHLALNAPIQSTEIRSPCITPLRGDFGPIVPGNPTKDDFYYAFWATSTQNGVKQTWAPLYTMFSRGNITEKSRVLNFPDVKDQEIADLYIGIGYFAFSYLKAGARRVWGWDLNAWSVEGLKRGAEMNRWSCAVNPGAEDEAQIMAYNEDNVKAVERLNAVGIKVKHVNLGFLPSSRGAWRIAAEILDERGGWIHIHGNCRDIEIDEWSNTIIGEFRRLFGDTWTTDVEERFRVKEFGPGVGHWVLDLACNRC